MWKGDFRQVQKTHQIARIVFGWICFLYHPHCTLLHSLYLNQNKELTRAKKGLIVWKILTERQGGSASWLFAHRRAKLGIGTKSATRYHFSYCLYSGSQWAASATALKSINLQYNTLVHWANGTNDSSTKCLTFFLFIISYRLIGHSKLFIFIFAIL